MVSCVYLVRRIITRGLLIYFRKITKDNTHRRYVHDYIWKKRERK